MRFTSSTLTFYLAITSTLSSNAYADIQSKQTKLNFSQRALTSDANPANTAIVVDQDHSHVMTGGMINTTVSLEYGELDEIFEAYNKLSGNFEPSVPPDTPTNPIEKPPLVDWDKVFERFPALEDRIDIVKDKVVSMASLLALIATEGYGKAEVYVEAPFIINTDFHGGTLLFGASYTGYAKALGILEQVEFNAEQAASELRRIPDFDPDDGIQELDLSGGVKLYYNPENQAIKVVVSNDSLLLVKSARISKINLSYSRKEFSTDYGDFYWGVKPTFYNVGMTNLGVRIGDLEDAESIFKDIRNGDYSYENGLDLDFGVSLVADNYLIAGHFKNVFESSYDFPEIDRRRFNSPYVLGQLDRNEEFTLERQLTLQAAIFTEDHKWSFSAELDANSTYDPMLDKYQWLNVSAGYATDSWWLPSARIGFSRNLVGSELSYVNAGLTFMRYVNLDIASTLDTVELDDDDYVRGLSISLGVQFDY
ncbi:conjugal transfer protein TraF [Thalassotalea sp. LPB0316]|uniref:conjugal transfer protein TraF n=1 Tax=Thalassotalea sp. LPB0316 TaxID=2769490 RepID=UPI001866A552|nr:conjugal transfer protein TraF [Thalassotalea sp. LPB0316]QOL25796.1 conjugal transfer protein TraF [Thalassotalea sp. LPB0316]